MYRLFQEFKDSDVTIEGEKTTFPKQVDDKNTYVFMEDQFKHCQCCKDKKFWTGRAETECNRNIKELKDRRKPWSRAYYCAEGDVNIVVMKTTDERRKADGYMNRMGAFNDSAIPNTSYFAQY